MAHHIKQQSFSYDALGNITSCTTQFVEGDQNTATYTYERSSGKDPCQLQAISHTHTDYPKQIALTYDTGGRLQADEHSRTLSYDACGRLASIAAGTSLPAASYQYDAFDRLVEQTIGADTTSLYYRASALVNQLTGTDTSQHQRFISGGIAQSTNEASPKTWLTGSDSQRNVLLTEQGETRETQTYSPYGYREPDAKIHSKLGYTGERRDPASGVYHLGNGYRSYNPVLMRFTAPDSWSPFGAGGINPYAYCAGDPISRADPSGHMSLGGWIGLGLGIVGGIAVSILTEGAALPAVASLIATAVADATVGVATQMIGMAADGERLDSLGAGGWGSIVGLSAVGTLSGWGLGKLARAGAARMAGRAASGAGKSSTITLGWGTMRDFQVLNRSGFEQELPFSIFVDSTGREAQFDRLNLVGHAVYSRNNRTAVTLIAGGEEPLQGIDLVNMLRERRMDFRQFASIRILMCDSARGERNSMAAQIARATSLTTTGFEGSVTIEGSFAERVMAVNNAIGNLDAIGQRLNEDLELAHHLWERGNSPAFRIRKDVGARLGDGRIVEYSPRKFHPTIFRGAFGRVL